MTCGVFYKRRHERAANVSRSAFDRLRAQQPRALSVVHHSKERVPQLLGTWDYKWPIGSKIRIAFQRPPAAMNISDAELNDACDYIEETANRWHQALDGEQYNELRKGLLPTFDFLRNEDQLFAPPLGVENSISDQHRSPFLAKDHIKYDVLISLQDLPVTRADPFRGFGEELEELIFPTCDLGSYARRSDYGAPTAYMGRFGTQVHSHGLLAYLQSNVGQHTIVHIFGHVLGLSHVHQHPTLVEGDRESFYRPVHEVIEFMKSNLGVELPAEMVKENLLDIWPGDLAFCDWLEFSDEERQKHARGILESVMAPPYYAAMIRGVVAPTGTKLLDDARTQPSLKDLDTLRLMYEPGATGLHVSQPHGAHESAAGQR